MRSGSADGIPEARAVQDAEEYTPRFMAGWAVAGPVKCVLSLRVRAASSAGRALRSQCRGRGFDPPAVHQPSLLIQAKVVRRSAKRAGGPTQRRCELRLAGPTFAHDSGEGCAPKREARRRANRLNELRLASPVKTREAALAASLRVRTSRPRQTSADGSVSARQVSDSYCGHALGAQAALHRCVRVMFSRGCYASHTLTCGRACWHVTCMA